MAILLDCDVICFYYRKSKEVLSVCIWYREESYDLELTVETIAESFFDF